MQLNISGQHLDVTSSLKDYVSEKLEKLERHFNHIIQIDVVLSVDNKIQKAEANVNLSGGKIFAHYSSNDMYASIDKLIDKLDSQVIKHKEKMKDHHNKHS